MGGTQPKLKMKNKKYYTVETIPKSIRKIVEKGWFWYKNSSTNTSLNMNNKRTTQIMKNELSAPFLQIKKRIYDQVFINVEPL